MSDVIQQKLKQQINSNLNIVREVIFSIENGNQQWNNIQNALLKAGKETLKTNKNQKWMISEIFTLMDERRKIKERNELKYKELQNQEKSQRRAKKSGQQQQ